MIRKVIKGLEVNEKDTMGTAIAKGMAEGAIDSALVYLAISGVLYLVANKKTEEVEETIQEEIAE